MDTNKTFREAACAYFRCTPNEYEAVVLRRCLYPHARFAASLVQWLSPRYFADDLELVKNVANERKIESMRVEVEQHRYSRPVRGILRKYLRLRISGRRLISFAIQQL